MGLGMSGTGTFLGVTNEGNTYLLYSNAYKSQHQIKGYVGFFCPRLTTQTPNRPATGNLSYKPLYILQHVLFINQEIGSHV